jgi:type II secretory pathway component PulC
MRLILLALLVFSSACSSVERREPIAPTIIEDEPEAEGDHRIDRAEYEQVLKDGLQKVMRWYYVKPAYKGSAFIGFQVEDILKEELKKGPLKPGDVIVTINDLPVERPEHAMAIWRGLWSKKVLTLVLMRKGQKIVYEIPIVSQQPPGDEQ